MIGSLLSANIDATTKQTSNIHQIAHTDPCGLHISREMSAQSMGIGHGLPVFFELIQRSLQENISKRSYSKCSKPPESAEVSKATFCCGDDHGIVLKLVFFLISENNFEAWRVVFFLILCSYWERAVAATYGLGCL